jgi:hypothetical protein
MVLTDSYEKPMAEILVKCVYIMKLYISISSENIERETFEFFEIVSF